MPDKTAYKPSDTHPWRKYKNARTQSAEAGSPKGARLQQFLKDIADNWDTYTIPSDDPRNFSEYTKIKNLTEQRAGEFIIGFIKKNFARSGGSVVYLD